MDAEAMVIATTGNRRKDENAQYTRRVTASTTYGR